MIQDLGDTNVVNAFARQSDGKYVVVGRLNSDFMIARLNTDGSLDTAGFGAPNGFVTLDLLGISEEAHDVAIQADGKIVVVGTASSGGPSNLIAARLNSDGSLDTAGFVNPDGFDTYSDAALGGFGQAIVLQADGKIVLAGYYDNNFRVVRVNSDGSTDMAQETDLGGTDRSYDIALQSDEKIILVGRGNGDFAVSRYTTEGELDITFNSPDGYQLIDLGYNVQILFDVAVDAQDRIVAVGFGSTGAASAMIVMRFTSDSALDTEFSGDGVVELNVRDTGEIANAVALGSILVGGTSGPGVETGNLIIFSLTTDPAAPSTTSTSSLPDTGFAPDVVTALEAQPPGAAYSAAAELQLAILNLGVSIPIVGVPQAADGWDVRWLGQQAGYLHSTAFPTLPGNTVLTGHVVDATGLPGPFADLQDLRYGDQVEIEAWEQTYTYEVRTNELYWPQDGRALAHEEYDWLTLITCEGFDEASGRYFFRRVVRAVLVDVH